ncbi:MerR family transcriptional regulator [Planomicrobium sp. CPCC 101110]|uniref:MerR family transcriptional regulator n=1 Tax=Planomicrobium sp. CPCC 101110 TaxID=2599619 RepID=UPI0011B83B38|nr:MerR family transcriptional regulator [Planomicrobium sp. CPCC 101110]TWT26561.1 MerR family transcriptional regulator [Planomicrobium sp. CPCC 101110]
MRIPIGRLVKELNLEAHQLREWEKRDWLGEVVKDPKQNHQRVYTEEQVERIQLIAETIQAQRTKGIKRTNFEEVEAKLLDRFGGEVKRIDTDLVVAPQSLNQIVELLMSQNQKISELQQLVQQQPKNQLRDPVDHTEVLADMKNEMKKSQEREEQLLALVQQLQSDLDELKKAPAKSKWKFWSKD